MELPSCRSILNHCHGLTRSQNWDEVSKLLSPLCPDTAWTPKGHDMDTSGTLVLHIKSEVGSRI